MDAVVVAVVDAGTDALHGIQHATGPMCEQKADAFRRLPTQTSPGPLAKLSNSVKNHISACLSGGHWAIASGITKGIPAGAEPAEQPSLTVNIAGGVMASGRIVFVPSSVLAPSSDARSP